MNILLEITGTQQIDSQQDQTQLTTVGTFEEDDSIYTIRYSEEQAPGLAPVQVCVKISKDEKWVETTRSGPFDSCLVIEKAKRNLCNYGTEYGDILMGISGHTIENALDGEKGEFNFSYDIDINGALVSCNKVKMNFRKNQE